MKTTFHTLLLVLACLLVGAAATDPTAAGPRRLLSTRRLRGGSRQLFGEKFWKKFPTTGGATGLGETLKTTASAYCDRFVEDSEEAAKPLSAKIKAINDQAAAGPKPSPEVATLRTQALKIFNDPQLHWIRFDAPKQSGCGATGCMCKPGSHSQEFDDVVIGVRDEVVASLQSTPLVCPLVREAVQRVVSGLSTPSDFCPNGGVHASYKAMAAQACGALGLAANDPLLTGRLKYEWLGRNKAGLDKHSGWMTTGKTCAEQVADSLLIACADAVRDHAPLSAMTREQVGAYISTRATACGGSRKHCACVAKTCTPSKGKKEGVAVHYPATGVLDSKGNAEWCFVDDACDTTQVGNGHSCDGAKFAFVDGRIPNWSKDTSPTFAVPHKGEGEKYAATFLASGCPVPRTNAWWKSGIAEWRIFQDMYDYCVLTRDGRANAVQRDVCCGAGKTCTPICTKQTRYTMTVDAARRNKRRKQCPCVAKTCTPTRGSNQGRVTHYPADGSLSWCFVADDCETTQVGNQHSCNGAKFAFVDGRIPSWSKDTAPTYAVPTQQ